MADIEKKTGDTAEAPARDAKVKKDENKKSVFSRIGNWFRSCKSEMKKVVWASRQTVIHNSIMVIAVIVVVAVAIALLELLLNGGIDGLGKII